MLFQNFEYYEKITLMNVKNVNIDYVCKDCRLMYEETNNKYSKEKFCTYNPYLGKWKSCTNLGEM